MKSFLIITLFALSCLNSFAQYTFPHIELPNYKEDWRTYVDAKDTKFDVIATCSDKKDNLYMLGSICCNSNANIQHLTTPNALQPNANLLYTSSSMCLIKFNSNGKREWGTYFGVGVGPWGGIACDSIGNVYICGALQGASVFNGVNVFNVVTTSNAFQTTQIPFITGTNQFRGEGFISKFSSTGILIWSTYYGGEGADVLVDLKIDKQNNIYILGSTNSKRGISTAGSFKEIFTPNNSSNQIGMLLKFNALGNRIWATYFGEDSSNTFFNKIELDSSGDIIAIGNTNAHNNIATVNTHMQQFSSAGEYKSRPFIAKFEPRAGFQIWGTYYGPSQAIGNNGYLEITSIATINNMIFFCGNTNLNNGISSVGSIMPVYAGNTDVFVVSLKPNGIRNWATYIGNIGADFTSTNSLGVSKEKKGLYLAGNTNSTVGISTLNTYNFEEIYGNPFLLKFKLDGTIFWSSYLSTYHNLQIPSGLYNNVGLGLQTTTSGILYTILPHPVQGSLPIGDTTVFQNIAGGYGPIGFSNLFTKYIDTTSTTVIVTPPPTNPPPTVFEIYPNPSNGIYTIRTTSTAPYDYIIYAADGKFVKMGNTNGYFSTLNMAAMAKGMYTIKAVERSSGREFVRKLVKL